MHHGSVFKLAIERPREVPCRRVRRDWHQVDTGSPVAFARFASGSAGSIAILVPNHLRYRQNQPLRTLGPVVLQHQFCRDYASHTRYTRCSRNSSREPFSIVVCGLPARGPGSRTNRGTSTETNRLCRATPDFVAPEPSGLEWSRPRVVPTPEERRLDRVRPNRKGGPQVEFGHAMV